MRKLINQFVGDQQTKEITVAELSLLLQSIDGSSATAISMLIATEPAWKKTDNKFIANKCLKVAKYNALLNINYTNSVNNQREKEGVEPDFQAQQNWHTKKYDSFNGCVACKMDGNKKQEYLFIKNNNSETLGYTIDGRVANDNEVIELKAFLPTKSAPKNQGIENPIIVQTIKLENIKLVKLKGNFYEVVS